jgi:hypothetical protein
LLDRAAPIIDEITSSAAMQSHWKTYQMQHNYASGIRFEDTLRSICHLAELLGDVEMNKTIVNNEAVVD